MKDLHNLFDYQLGKEIKKNFQICLFMQKLIQRGLRGR